MSQVQERFAFVHCQFAQMQCVKCWPFLEAVLKYPVCSQAEEDMQRLTLTVQEESEIERLAWPVTRGVPHLLGALQDAGMDEWL